MFAFNSTREAEEGKTVDEELRENERNEWKLSLFLSICWNAAPAHHNVDEMR